MIQGDLEMVKDSSAQDIFVANYDNGGGGRGEANDLYPAKINGSVNKDPVG